jgi:hypothetical protein
VSAWSVEEMRELLMRDPEMPRHARQIAQRVHDRTCTCCPGPGTIELDCGHFLCELCEQHACLACALAS